MGLLGILKGLFGPPVPTLSAAEALERIGQADVVFVDVREPDEHQDGGIPGALRLPLVSGVLYERWAELPRERDLILYCRSGLRSKAAARFLLGKEYSRIFNLRGGFMAYARLADAKIQR